MAQIAEDLLLLLLDNESGQPRLPRSQLGRVMAAALLLDLAHDCRVRPAGPGDAAQPGHLVALAGPVPLDPAVRPALALLERGPLTADAAITRLRKHAEDDVLDQLLRSGQIHQIQLSSHRLRRNSYAWPMHDRRRIDGIRGAVTAALFGGMPPQPATAATIALLHTIGGLGTVLNIDENALGQAAHRAGEITFGAWGHWSAVGDVNLAVTAAAVLPALG